MTALTHKTDAFEAFYSFMQKETYNLFTQYIIEVWQSTLHISSGSWNDWHPRVTENQDIPVYAVPYGNKLYNVRVAHNAFGIMLTDDAFGLMVTLRALHGLLLDIKDDRLPTLSDAESKQIRSVFDGLLRYARSHAEANDITPEFDYFYD